MNEETQLKTAVMNNQPYTTANIIAIRLDVEPLLAKIEAFLRAQRIVQEYYTDPATGTPAVREVIKQYGTPKVNDLGVQSIMSYICTVINPQVVQGNYKEEWWRNHVFHLRVDLIRDLVINQDSWGIKDADLEHICDGIMNLMAPFMTRLINDRERGSYSNFEVRESTAVQHSPGLFGFGGRK